MGEYFTSCTKPTPQTILQVKAYYTGFLLNINVTCENNCTSEISPTKCSLLNRKIIGGKSANESVSCWGVNIKLIIAAIATGVVSYEVVTLLSVYDLTNSTILKKYFQGLSNMLDAVLSRHPGGPWLMHSKMKPKLILMRSMSLSLSPVTVPR